MNTFPKAKRQLEYVAFFNFKIPTQEGVMIVFAAIDAYSQYVFKLGFEQDETPQTVIKNISMLLKSPDFIKHSKNGFTLVLEKYNELNEQIKESFGEMKGQVMFDKNFNSHISKPFLEFTAKKK